ncbi:3-hydroxybutyryl-CoA dehydrogenase [Octadecabacter temperatus]|nr:3-hydroxybutyryl-CoA dehydrogenase [Octadecabacter temperatus]
MDIQNVAVIGAGQMGTGIAQVFAQSKFHTQLSDVSPEALVKGMGVIEANLNRLHQKGKISREDVGETLRYIHPVLEMSEIGRAELVIEAATEDEKVKRDIFKSLTPHLSKDAILASNTSSISITRLASATDRPEQFLGVHFMNPVPVMQLVELIRGIATDEIAFLKVQDVVAKIGKIATVSEDYPAFIVNRVLIPMINEAVYALFEGVGSVISIDTSMKLGANHPMGPFELADFIGLDTCLSIMMVLNDGLHDSKYRPCPLLQKYVDAGWLGRKTGRGFYDYRHGDPTPTR